MISKHTTLRQWIGVPLVCGALGAGGCSAAQPPTETAAVAQAELATRQATESKAAQYAPVELRLAQEKLNGARAAMAEEHHERARRLAEQALVDAQLAESRAESESARQTAGELRRSIEALRVEAERAAAAH